MEEGSTEHNKDSIVTDFLYIRQGVATQVISPDTEHPDCSYIVVRAREERALKHMLSSLLPDGYVADICSDDKMQQAKTSTSKNLSPLLFQALQYEPEEIIRVRAKEDVSSPDTRTAVKEAFDQLKQLKTTIHENIRGCLADIRSSASDVNQCIFAGDGEMAAAAAAQLLRYSTHLNGIIKGGNKRDNGNVPTR